MAATIYKDWRVKNIFLCLQKYLYYLHICVYICKGHSNDHRLNTENFLCFATMVNLSVKEMMLPQGEEEMSNFLHSSSSKFRILQNGKKKENQYRYVLHLKIMLLSRSRLINLRLGIFISKFQTIF